MSKLLIENEHVAVPLLSHINKLAAQEEFLNSVKSDPNNRQTDLLNEIQGLMEIIQINNQLKNNNRAGIFFIHDKSDNIIALCDKNVHPILNQQVAGCYSQDENQKLIEKVETYLSHCKSIYNETYTDQHLQQQSFDQKIATTVSIYLNNNRFSIFLGISKDKIYSSDGMMSAPLLFCIALVITACLGIVGGAILLSIGTLGIFGGICLVVGILALIILYFVMKCKSN